MHLRPEVFELLPIRIFIKLFDQFHGGFVCGIFLCLCGLSIINIYIEFNDCSCSAYSHVVFRTRMLLMLYHVFFWKWLQVLVEIVYLFWSIDYVILLHTLPLFLNSINFHKPFCFISCSEICIPYLSFCRALLHFLDHDKFKSKDDFVQNYKNLSSFNENEVGNTVGF